MAVVGPERIMAPFSDELLVELKKEQEREIKEHPSPWNPNPELCPYDFSILGVTKHGYCCMLLICDFTRNWAYDPNW